MAGMQYAGISILRMYQSFRGVSKEKVDCKIKPKIG